MENFDKCAKIICQGKSMFFFLINDAEYSHESEKLDSILKSYIDINLKNTDLNKLKLEKHIE